MINKFIITALSTLLLSGCEVTHNGTTIDVINKGVEICQPNGGLKYVLDSQYTTLSDSIIEIKSKGTVVCQNGLNSVIEVAKETPDSQKEVTEKPKN